MPLPSGSRASRMATSGRDSRDPVAGLLGGAGLADDLETRLAARAGRRCPAGRPRDRRAGRSGSVCRSRSCDRCLPDQLGAAGRAARRCRTCHCADRPGPEIAMPLARAPIANSDAVVGHGRRTTSPAADIEVDTGARRPGVLGDVGQRLADAGRDVVGQRAVDSDVDRARRMRLAGRSRGPRSRRRRSRGCWPQAARHRRRAGRAARRCWCGSGGSCGRCRRRVRAASVAADVFAPDRRRDALQAQPDREQLLDDVVVQVARDPVAVLEQHHALLVRSRGRQFERDAGMVGEARRPSSGRPRERGSRDPRGAIVSAPSTLPVPTSGITITGPGSKIASHMGGPVRRLGGRSQQHRRSGRRSPRPPASPQREALPDQSCADSPDRDLDHHARCRRR